MSANVLTTVGYLYRKEGDQDSAAYRYSRAGKPVCREPLDAEWLDIVSLSQDPKGIDGTYFPFVILKKGRQRILNFYGEIPFATA